MRVGFTTVAWVETTVTLAAAALLTFAGGCMVEDVVSAHAATPVAALGVPAGTGTIAG